MKSFLHAVAWSAAAAAIVYLAVNPAHGVVYQNPINALGLGLIGLGLCRQAAPAKPARPAQ